MPMAPPGYGNVKVEDSQGGSGARGSGDAGGPPDIDSLIDSELKQYLSPQLKKAIKKESRELVDKIRALSKTQQRIEKLKSDISVTQFSGSCRHTSICSPVLNPDPPETVFLSDPGRAPSS